MYKQSEKKFYFFFKKKNGFINRITVAQQRSTNHFNFGQNNKAFKITNRLNLVRNILFHTFREKT
jgi:hypothetical protein